MKTLLFMFVLAICSTIGLGQTPQQATGNETTIRSGPVTLSADQLISDSTIGSIKGRGNVSVDIRNGKFKFQADQVDITINQNAGSIDVQLRGNVRGTIVDAAGSTQKIETNAAHLDIKL